MASDSISTRPKAYIRQAWGTSPHVIRLLLVGDEGVSVDWRPTIEETKILGCVPADELVAAVDSLKPDVLLLDPALAGLVSRLASCPAALVVAPRPTSKDPDEGQSLRADLLDIAAHLAVARL